MDYVPDMFVPLRSWHFDCLKIALKSRASQRKKFPARIFPISADVSENLFSSEIINI